MSTCLLLAIILIVMVIAFSIYYQIFSWRRNLTKATIAMSVEDRIMNEVAYQITKRGYYVRFHLRELEEHELKKGRKLPEWLKKGKLGKYLNAPDAEMDYVISVKKCNLPKRKKSWVKFISFLHVASRPAWAYREFDEEDDMMYDEERDKNLKDWVR